MQRKTLVMYHGCTILKGNAAMPKANSAPSYLHHKARNLAKTIVNGKTIYLGPYNSPESQEKFSDIVAEWRLRQNVDQYALKVDELAWRFLEHAEAYYVHKDGTPTGNAANMRYALMPLIDLHGKTRVRDFGPLKLQEVRQQMIQDGHSRTYINGMIAKIRQVFRWGTEQELVPATIYQALLAVRGLAAGRSKARESTPVLPVDEGTVNDTLPHLPTVVADMVRLQLLTGARPGEVCAIRPCDITRGTSGVWTFRPSQHKTQHFGRERRIFIGPEGQAILSKYMLRDSEAYCFSPLDSEAERSATRREQRQTPMTPSQSARKPRGRTIKDRYDRNTYNRAIARGCELAFGMAAELRYPARTAARLKDATEAERTKFKQRLEQQAAEWRLKHVWSPNQLRHSRATAIRERFGIEAAQTVLGHSDPKVTLVYAERDFATAERIMREIG